MYNADSRITIKLLTPYGFNFKSSKGGLNGFKGFTMRHIFLGGKIPRTYFELYFISVLRNLETTTILF